MKLCLLLFSLNVFLIFVNHVESVDKKWQQKSFDEIFGEKWEEKQRNEEKKTEIIEKYYKIKEKIKQKGKKYSTKEWVKIEQKIAKKLGTNRIKIYEWIKELGLNQKIMKNYKSKTDEQKILIVQKFIEMTKEYRQKRKYSHNEWNQNYDEICKKIGISKTTIIKWKKQFAISKKRITEEEKMEKMNIYWQLKNENPKMSDNEIAKIVNTSNANICNWKKKYEEEMFEN